MAKYLDRTVAEVMDFGRDEIRNPDRGYKMLCQSFCRTAYDVPAWAPSAIAAWRRIPADQKHRGNPEDAPRGALLYYEIGKHGHVAIAAGKRTHDKCLSNDYVRQGEIDYAPRSFVRWGARYLGWSTWTPFGSLRLDK